MAQPQPSDIESLDENLAPVAADGGLAWYDIGAFPLEGKGWSDTAGAYDRLPARAAGTVRPEVWDLSRRSSGMLARFVTDATTLSARWTLRFEPLAMIHMAAAAVSGLDLYARRDGRWRWAGVAFAQEVPHNEIRVQAGLAPARREFALYLPLYNGVEQVQIGVPPEAFVAPAPPRPADAATPVVCYGTSIVMGGCASRVGMAYPAILGRRLDRPTINLGFSGNGRMEIELAALLGELDAAAYVLDCLPNLEEPLVTERAAPFVRRLREAKPDTPIVLVENVRYQDADFVPARRARFEASNAALRAAYERLRADGVPALHYVEGAALLGDDDEATVDGTHCTDLGFVRIADAIEPALRAAL